MIHKELPADTVTDFWVEFASSSRRPLLVLAENIYIYIYIYTVYDRTLKSHLRRIVSEDDGGGCSESADCAGRVGASIRLRLRIKRTFPGGSLRKR